jgi:hypothetical protein
MRFDRLFPVAAGWTVLCTAATLSAQETRTVRGTVLSEDNGLPVGGATVAVARVQGRRVSSSPSGSFSIRVPVGEVRLVAARVGFAPETLAVAVDQPEVTFRLRAAALAVDPLIVTTERSFSTASSSVIRELDIQLRPRESAQELLRLTPGLVIAQHGGGGKAEQIFLRGFDADHGTDVAISVDGSPVNMVSHGHGQGYADLHFLIPEVVERVDVRKGPYDARDGDFATAGAVTFRTRDRIPEPLVAVRYGSFRTGRALAMAPFGGDATRPGGYVALAANTARGPFESPQDYGRLTFFGKYTAPISDGVDLFASASGFGARWNQSGQVPERAVESGLIGRFGSIDPSEGGDTERYDVNVGLRSEGDETSQWEVRAFGARYDFQLFSNFTFFLNDPVSGDGIEQTDDRYLGGVQGTYRHLSPLLGRDGAWLLGAGARMDRADVALFHQRERERLGTRVDTRIAQANFFSWVQREIALSERVRLQVGVRSDLFRFRTDDRLVGVDRELPHASGVRWRGIVSPKANLAVRIAPTTDLYVNTGTGFHSNDARDVIQSRHTDRVLPRAVGAEIGTRHTWSRGSVAAALWRLDLQSELVYVGDEGITEANGPTRRTGVDLEGRLQLARWLWADLDLNLARGRYRDLPAGQNHIPLAPTATSTGGLTVRDAGPVEGGLRYRFIGSRPANEDASVTARGYAIWEAFGVWRVAGASVFAAVDNLFDTTWNEAQFDTESRLRGESFPVSELHFTPGAPRSVQVGIEYRF